MNTPAHASAAHHPCNPSQRLSRQLTVTNPHGLHLRAAAQIVKLAHQFNCAITLKRACTSANARSILKVASLAASFGDTIDISARGPDAAMAIDALANLFAAGFSEDPDEKSGFADAGLVDQFA
jgi:phosphotransferase system HPr (HPr) family protein